MYLTKAELGTHLYQENMEVITRGDDTMVTAAIDAAISEAKGYLGAFDRDAIFNATGTARNALLLTFIKDIAAWHLINLCNAGTEFQIRQDRYDRAVNWLKEVQKGNVSPDLPASQESADTDDVSGGSFISYGSNPQRSQHF
ncbi:MAG: phage protein Gp36 family protein [Smithella sp.]